MEETLMNNEVVAFHFGNEMIPVAVDMVEVACKLEQPEGPILLEQQIQFRSAR
jgi:hypothetical protein